LLAPDKVRHGRNNILFETTNRSEFGNEIIMQSLECHWIFSGQKGGPGVGTMFESRRNSITSLAHELLPYFLGPESVHFST
jgi:hypothetical protein